MKVDIEILILGIVQGLTEFLPISSSGHLALLGNLFGLKENSVTIAVLLHFATLLAVIIFFRKDVFEIFKSARSITMLIAVSIPTAVIGFLLSKSVKNIFETNVGIVYIFLFFTGVLIFLADRIRINQIIDNWNEMPYVKAILIGIAQGIAVLPGISRSGATISAGIFSGLSRVSATRFSFLTSIPAVFGATLFEMKDAKFSDLSSLGIVLPTFIAMAAAFLSGIFSLWFLFRIVKTPNFKYFAYYLWLVSIVGLLKKWY